MEGRIHQSLHGEGNIVGRELRAIREMNAVTGV